jgi:uncharacterized protein
MTRILSADALSHDLDPLRPGFGLAELADLGGAGIGLWEMGPGEDHDTEADEVFVVLAGTGTVAFEDGTTLDLRPGVVVRLHAGDRTVWTVTETLRKLYVTGP